MEPPLILGRRELTIAMFGLFASACAHPLARAHELTLANVVRRNTRARGGGAALDRVHALLMDVEIDEAGQKLNGRYAANVEGLVRIDIYVGGKFAGAEGIDRDGVWTWGDKGPQPSVADGAANALKHGAEDKLYGWHRFAARGHKLALLPPQAIDGVSYPIVEIRYSTGHISYFYLDPATWQAVRRRDERAFHPDVDPTKQRVETRFSQYEAVEGVVMPHRDQDFDLGSGKLLATHRVLNRRVNPALPADYFNRGRKAPAAWS